MPDLSDLTEEFVYRAAPDGQSVKAAQGLLRDDAFSQPRASADGALLQARCRGSEPRPYSVEVDLSDPKRLRTVCNCSSRKLPCKHALGLLLLGARSPDAFERDASAAAARPGRDETLISTPRKPAVPQDGPPADLEESLLQSILAEPEDDGLRLIYADWLEDEGRSDRAEFIRVQIESAGLAESDPRRKALQAREKKLWSAHREEWLSTLPAHLRKQTVRFHKGFFEELFGPIRHWVHHCATPFSRHPIHRIRLQGRVGSEEVGALAVVPQLSRVRTLVMAGCRLDDPNKNLPILFGTPFLSGLRRLDLSGTGLSTRELGAIVGTTAFAHVREMDLSGNAIGPKGAEALAEAATMEGLRELSLANNPIGDAGGKALAQSPHLERLTRLDLSGVALGKAVVAALRARFGERVVLD